jgi:hypothetical protein
MQGGGAGGEEHLIRSASIPSMWTFHAGNRVQVELLFLLVCMCAGISRLHRPSRNTWLFCLAYGRRRFELPTYDPQIWESEGSDGDWGIELIGRSSEKERRFRSG